MARITQLGSYRVHNDEVSCLAFLPDGQRLASVTSEWDEEEDNFVGVLKVWHPTIGVLASHRDIDCGGFLAVSSQGFLAWGTVDGHVRLFEPTTQQEIKRIHLLGRRRVSPLLFSPDGRWLLTAAAVGAPDSEGEVSLWNVATWQEEGKLATGWVSSLAITANAHFLMVGLVSGVIQIWNLSRRSCCVSFPAHTADILTLSVNSTGTLLASVGRADGLKLWQLQEQPPICDMINMPSGNADPTDAHFLPSGHLVTGDTAGAITLWDSTLQPVEQVSTRVPLVDMEMVLDETQVTLESEKPIPVSILAVSADGRRIASGDIKGGVQIWSVDPTFRQ
jgi:WD40 repeat protein